MAFSSMAPEPYTPRWPGTVELNLQDQWRARWVDEQELPDGAPVAYVYAMVLAGDKGYLARPKEGGRWEMFEGAVGEEEASEFVERELAARLGVTAARLVLIGFLECKATRHNASHPMGTVTVRPLYLAIAGEVGDVPPASEFQRRRLPMNEFMVALRARYPELDDHLQAAAAEYAVMRARGEA